MELNLSITRRTAVIGVATLLAAGGAVAIGLSGGTSAPNANAAPFSSSALAGDGTAVAPDAFPGITVQGTGKVTGTPDTLILSLAVSKTAGDVSTAMNDLSATVGAVQSSLTGNHVAAADQKTSGLNVGPQYDNSGGKQTVTGYQASENMTVTLRDTKSAGAVIAAASTAGGNATQISGLSTDLQNDAGPLNQARDAAFNDAKAKAAQYAKSAGRTLGQVVRVEESDGNTQIPVNYGSPAAAGGSAVNPVPIQVGSTDVTVQVTVVFSFA
ncbi:SIMPL domain-containing protein [Catenulispora pinisilvae]|uniref:SIMPL domain-containing protein n=1 Tax=Catenulispora pinisilvae TaxID=2705253 RepID=UPI001891F909|nr:SIMPL domain-containing protein [Catenulispora pinisilvae]